MSAEETGFPEPDGDITAKLGAALAAAKFECEHYWAYHCYRGMSVRLCQLCHEPDWDDLARQLREAATGTSPEAMLREFHTAMAVHNGWMPAKPTAQIPNAVRESRWSLLSEELRELSEADTAGDIVGIADGIADIVYVLVGTAVVHGIPFDQVFREVHRSNMTKVNVPGKPKLIKGPGYRPPQIAEILAGGRDSDREAS